MSTESHRSPVPDRLFRPRSIAVIGASSDPTKLSNKPLSNLLRLGFAGRVYVVNPSVASIDGIPSYPSVADLPEVPDVAFLVVPGARALDAATACAQRGVAAAIVASTGFAEAGPEGVARQQALTELTRQHGIRFVGPNTNGFYSAHDRLSLGYNSAHEEAFEPGGVSIVSHSGALFNVIGERMRAERVGLSKFIAVGNEVDLDMLDFLEFLIGDDTTRTVLLIVEALRDGSRFMRLAQRARQAGKRIAALKLGMSPAGVASTAAHSSRLAGNARAYQALFSSAGFGRVDSIEALVAFARLDRATSTGWAAASRSLGLVTASGAAGTILADNAAQRGFSIASPTAETVAQLSAINPDSGVFNPLDVANFGGSRNAGATVPLLSCDANVDAVVVYGHKLQTPGQREAFAESLVVGRAKSQKPHLVIAPGGLPDDQRKLLEDGGVPVFGDSVATMDALSALFGCSRHDGAQNEVMSPESNASSSTSQQTLDEYESMRRLDAAGIPTVARALVESSDAAVAFAQKIGWPVVMKGLADGIAHKSDAGLVRLGLDSVEAVRENYAELKQLVSSKSGAGTICVQKMVGPGFEIIAGVTHEPQLGRFLLVGLGGRHAERLDDVHLWAVPTSEEAIRRQLTETSVGRVLTGPRWQRATTFNEVVSVLLKLQRTALENPEIRAIEINPLWAGDSATTALDALIITD